MKIYPVIHEYFKLDGGAMFGVVPKVIWQRTNPADEDNLIQMAARSLLIEKDDKLILIDTGMGNKQSDKFFGYYKPRRINELDKILNDLGYTKTDITDVVMTHLHFDHCGGSVIRDAEGNLVPAFPNARYWTNEPHWKWALNPNRREKASFLKENFVPLHQANVLHFIPVPDTGNRTSFPELGMEFLFVNGHTEKQMIPIIRHQGKTLVYMADLLPTTGHIPLPYVMAYDVRPLITLDEKEAFLNEAADQGYYLFLEHDPQTEVCTVKHTEKGVRLDKTFRLNEIFKPE